MKKAVGFDAGENGGLRLAEITGGEHERLGDAVLAAQSAYAEEGVMPELLAILTEDGWSGHVESKDNW